MLQIIKYIFKKNKGLDIIKYLFLGLLFQIFKRVSKSIISKKIFNNKSLFLYPNCNISTMYTYTNIPDLEEVLLLRKMIKEHTTKKVVFLDIGANIGSYSVSLMDICTDIIAFEPHPYTAERCKMNFLLNHYSSDNVKQIALSDEIGKIYFSDYGNSSTINHIIDDNTGIEVEVTTMDEFFKKELSSTDSYIVKIDVEGFEEQVLLGGEMFFTTKNVLGIVFECFGEDSVFDILKQYGFKTIEKLSENNYIATKN